MSEQIQAQALIERADLLVPNAIRAAAGLGLADHVAAGDDTVERLVDRTGTDPSMLVRLLRLLVELELFERDVSDDPVRYRLTEAGSPLRHDHTFSVRDFLDPNGVFGRAELGFVGLLGSVRSGGPAYAAAFGRNYWDDVNSDPALAQSLRNTGNAAPAWDAHVVVEGYDWSTVRHVTDVGGNNGVLLIALLRAHPHLRGRVLDLPANAAIAGERLADAGLTAKAEAVAASFFDPLPGDSDVYLLSGILGDWTDEHAVAILRRCAEAAGASGKILVADIRLQVSVHDRTSAVLDLSIAATVPAPARTQDEIAILADRAGLTVTWVGPETPTRSVLELAVRTKTPAEGVRGLAAVR